MSKRCYFKLVGWLVLMVLGLVLVAWGLVVLFEAIIC